jgi:long-chain fatty acid transport protein
MTALNRMLKLSPIAALFAATLPALATNGYFPHGYGLKAKGMGGAATALAQDSLGGATNPASMVWAGTRLDVGIDVFMPTPCWRGWLHRPGCPARARWRRRPCPWP